MGKRTRRGSAQAQRRSELVTLVVSPAAVRGLAELLATGLFGWSQAEVARQLLYAQMRRPEVAYFSRTLAHATRPPKTRRGR